MAERITKEEALSFLLTHIVVEQGVSLGVDQLILFQLMNLAAQGTQLINGSDEVTPHEVLEELAADFLQNRE